MIRGVVWLGAAASAAGTVHSAVNRRQLRHLRSDQAAGADSVSVLIPARDEAATISECLDGVRAQAGDLQVVVLDDNSTDGTATVAAAAAAGDDRIEIARSGLEPPAGWLGKPHVCRQLARMATGDVYVFLDADVRLQPGAVAAAVSTLRGGADLVSAWPRQVAGSPLARLVQPLQQWSWLTTLPLAVARRSARESMAAANGQFLVVDARAYDLAGGHAAVKGDVLDDIALARAFKRAGLTVDLADASAVATCRMYGSDRELVDGYAKSLWHAFGGPVRGLSLGAALAAVYVLPPAYAVFGRHPATRVAGGIGYLAGAGGRAITARATGGPAWPDPLAHPASIAVLAGLIAVSVVRRRRGTLRWRGRPVTL